MNIFEKMQVAKLKILTSNLKKSGKNKFAGYTYYELADLIPTIIQVCNETKLFTQISFDNEKATLTIINSETPEEKLTYTSPMKDLELKGANEIQALGGVETYQRRYLYMAAFDIIENDMFDGVDPEINDKKKQPTKPKVEPKVNDETISLIISNASIYAGMKNGDTNELLKYYLKKYKVAQLKDLSQEQGTVILGELQNCVERSKKQ